MYLYIIFRIITFLKSILINVFSYYNLVVVMYILNLDSGCDVYTNKVSIYLVSTFLLEKSESLKKSKTANIVVTAGSYPTLLTNSFFFIA